MSQKPYKEIKEDSERQKGLLTIRVPNLVREIITLQISWDMYITKQKHHYIHDLIIFLFFTVFWNFFIDYSKYLQNKVFVCLEAEWDSKDCLHFRRINLSITKWEMKE